MRNPTIRAFIAARMRSARFPGKVLAPLHGRPVIAHVIAHTAQVLPKAHLTVVTSDDPSDDPLVSYVRDLGVSVHRGSLENVFARFRTAAMAHPCEWILRICADSPMLNVRVLSTVVAQQAREDCDVVTTLYPRTFPKGQNAELIRTATFMAVETSSLSQDDREHVTSYFYRHPARFRLVNVGSGHPESAQLNLAVDTVEDLQRLERLTASQLPSYPSMTVAVASAGQRQVSCAHSG